MKEMLQKKGVYVFEDLLIKAGEDVNVVEDVVNLVSM